MAASLLRVEAANSGLLGRLARDVLPEGHTGNGAWCPPCAAGPTFSSIPQCRPFREHVQPAVKADLLPGAWHGTGQTAGATSSTLGQVRQSCGWRWLHRGRQPQNATSGTSAAVLTRAEASATPAAPVLPAVVRQLTWHLAEARSAVASVGEAVSQVPLLRRLPAAVRVWLALAVAAAACVAASFAVSRLVLGPLALAMAVVGDFGEVGPARRHGRGLRPQLKKQKAIEMEGEVQKALPNAMFQVALDNGCLVLAHISGKIRRNRIEIFQGDRVKVEISPYDLTRGRITHRNRRAGQGGPAPPGGPPGGAPAPA